MTTPRLCVTVSAPTMAELRTARDQAATVADLVELRLDGVRGIDVQGALAGRLVPVVVTCRPRREGGAFDGPEDQRLAFLKEAARLGAEYVDVEFDSAFGPLVADTGGRGVILSSHDFSGVPSDLAARFRAMRAVGAEVVKIAVMAHSLGDNLPLLALGREATEPAEPDSRGEVRVLLDVRRRGCRIGPDVTGTPALRVSVQVHHVIDTPVRNHRPASRTLGIARCPQRGLRGLRVGRRIRAARGQ